MGRRPGLLFYCPLGRGLVSGDLCRRSFFVSKILPFNEDNNMNLKTWFGIVALFLTCFLLTASSAEDPAVLRQEGITALKDSQTNPDAIVLAARCFAKASALYEASGKPELAVEMNSYLYWCKKKMTMRDIDEFLKAEEPVVTARLTAVEKKAGIPSEALKSADKLDRAETFAHKSPVNICSPLDAFL